MKTNDWSQSQLDRKAQVESGITVVAHVSLNSPDKVLVDWAEANGYFVYVGDNENHTGYKRSIWYNPDKPGKDKSEERRNYVCDKYKNRIDNTPELLATLPELKGKVLGCWCHPLRCHGDYLAELVNDKD
jgi:hypothetical protein